MSDTPKEDFEWLFDYIVTFLKSPPWTVPLNTFIDENCIIFDSDDDNKLAYTPVHQKFCELVESLLSSNLDAIGVSDEQFVAACGVSQNQEVNKLVFGQIMAVDDFLTFKKMMVKRNMELNIEAMEAYKREAAGGAGAAEMSEEDRRRQHEMNNERMPEDEALQMAIALKISQEEAGMGGAGGGQAGDELGMAVKMSLIEQEISTSQYDSEQAELEHAIAMSLALETERLRLLALESGGGDAGDNQDSAASSSASSSSQPQSQQRTALPTSLPDDEPPSPAPASSGKSKSSLPPINMRGRGAAGGGTFDADQYERDRRELDDTLARAQSSFRANADVSAAAKQSTAQVAKQANVGNDELARRQKFLRQQRDLILAKKARARASELAEFERSKQEAGPLELPPSVVKRVAAAPSSSSSSNNDNNGGVDDKRAMMRAALASRLKQDYLAVKQRRSYEKASSQFGQLDEQLQQVEQLRADKQARAAADTAQALEAEYERQRRAQEFHMSLAANAHDDQDEI